MKEKIKFFLAANPNLKKVVGVILVVIGLLALVTPFTPGSWLIFVGLELLGVELIFWDKIKKGF